MQKTITQIQDLDAGLLVDKLDLIENNLKKLFKSFQPKQPTEYLSRKDVAAMLGVSLVTVSEWTKKGLLRSFKLGNRVYYKRNEVENSLTEIKHR